MYHFLRPEAAARVSAIAAHLAPTIAPASARALPVQPSA